MSFEMTGDGFYDDFRNCVYDCMRRTEGVRPNRVQYDMADFLQYGPERGGPRFRFAGALRGEGKSLLTSYLVPWRLARDFVINNGKVTESWMVVSAAADRAENFTGFVQSMIEMIPRLRVLLPRDPDRWSLSAFDVAGKAPSHMPSVVSRSVFGRLTGDRPKNIAFDDIEVPATSETQGMRDRLYRRSQEFVDLIKPPVESTGELGGEMVGLGTPQVEESIYYRIHEWGFTVRLWPAEYPGEKWLQANGHNLSPMLKDDIDRGHILEPSGEPGRAVSVGDPIDPDRFGIDELAMKKSAGLSRYHLQYMLDTTLSDAERYPLRCSDLIVMDLDPVIGPEYPVWAGSTEYVKQDLPCVGLKGDRYHRPMLVREDKFVPYDYIAAALDPAGKGKDEMPYAIGGCIGGYLFLLKVGVLPGGYSDELLDPMVEDLAAFRVKALVVEENFGGGSVEALVQRRVHEKVKSLWEGWAPGPDQGDEPWRGCGVIPVHHHTQKELRIIDTLEPVMNQHRLCVSTQVVTDDRPQPGEGGEHFRLFHQLTRVTRERGCLVHDDRLDCVAMLARHLSDRMSVVQDERVQARKDDEERQMWDHYWDHQLGKREAAPATWASNRSKAVQEQ